MLDDVSTIDYSICESQLGYDIASSRTGKIHRELTGKPSISIRVIEKPCLCYINNQRVYIYMI